MHERAARKSVDGERELTCARCFSGRIPNKSGVERPGTHYKCSTQYSTRGGLRSGTGSWLGVRRRQEVSFLRMSKQSIEYNMRNGM